MQPRIGTREEWLAARSRLLRDEKALMRYKDYIAAQRRDLPWVAVEEDYRFVGASGAQTLADLFDGYSQLIVYHFMFGADWEHGCPGCTQVANTFNQSTADLRAADTNLVAVSTASLTKLKSYADAMQWSFPWVSCPDGRFNIDYHASRAADGVLGPQWSFQGVDFDRDENHGVSVFRLHEGRVYHTYSSYQRSVEVFMVHLQLLDLCPDGR